MIALADPLARIVVALTGLYLVTLGLVACLVPDRAQRFLAGFAGSASRHYAELLARLVAGAAFLQHSPHALLPGTFAAFGWALLVTTAGLLCVPWRLHRRFATVAVGRLERSTWLVSLVSLGLGAFVLAAGL